ncbi:2OG-Fe(II) oxygenase [Streptomyces sp. NRRL F-2747]|uniref:2OG-Fe(II) oxygenase n=1 Tax=Streptomyces sp. NRRL F-2747 TaxID=1463843 RepID=UPI0004CAC540|nr:2OG-Fe(II) oxygenase [Streptomyces sp. NRRL F-2747]
MKITMRTPCLTVVDDFLGEAEFTSLATSLQFLSYRPMHSKEWVKAYGLSSAPVLQSELATRGRVDTTPPGMSRVGELVERIARPEEALQDSYPRGITGDGSIVTGRTVLSGVGAALNWHNDAESLLGAYVFYGHPRWGSTWGGELLVLAEDEAGGGDGAGISGGRPRETNGDLGPDFMLDARAEQYRNDIGHGIFVSARPNRLVLLTSRVHHRVAPVTPSAGDQPRTAVVGFFVSDAGRS